MDGPDFSEDDLINDYVDDYEEPVQEEYWEAMAEEQDEDEKQSNETQPGDSAATAEPNVNHDFPQTTLNSATSVSVGIDLEQDHELPVRSLLFQPRKDDHLYSFER